LADQGIFVVPVSRVMIFAAIARYITFHPLALVPENPRFFPGIKVAAKNKPEERNGTLADAACFLSA
jgi:hypothetical protein